MATYIGLGTDEPEENSEQRVAKALKRLPAEWRILHHVSWQSKRSGRQGDGEADFIVFHPRKGMLVIEVKGGGIDVVTGRWFTTDRHGKRSPIKNPYEQATASKHVLVSWLREHGLGTRIRVGHAVAFPHMESLPPVGPSATAEISLTRPLLEDIDAAIDKCFRHWELEAGLSAADADRLVALLAPTISVRPRLSSQSSEAEAEILMFTAEQTEAFSGLRANRGGLILGGAGTGKTVLAIARAQQLARDGFKTLLVCYNELLGRDLSTRTENPPCLIACTYHALCLREARQANLRLADQKSADWWEKEAPNLLIEACAINGSQYDAVVVDEGQDFSPLWFNSLRCIISAQPDAPFFTFADPLQDVWKRDWLQGMENAFIWELTRNLRNTHPIATRVAATMNMECRSSGVSGPNPIWVASDGAPGERDIICAVERLLDEGFGPANMAVLCGSAGLASRLRERSVGAYSFGNWGSRGIVVETISRFKGLEAQAIVLALPPITSPEEKIEAYIGMSRARSILVVIGRNEDCHEVNWPSSMS